MRPQPCFRLYAGEVSLFSAKLRAALRRKALPYVEILATAQVYRDVIVKRTRLGFIPILVTPADETLQDTSEILDWLEEHHPEPPLEPSTPVQRVTARLFELYADEFLLLPAMHYRWGTREGSADAQARITAMLGDPGLGKTASERMRGACGALGVSEAAAPAIEAHTRDLLDALEAHLEEQPFLLGGAPSLADCAAMGPFYAHLYRDVVPARIFHTSAPRVCHWIERTCSPDPDLEAAWLEKDALAATLRPVLALIGHDAVPLILDTVRAVEAWADDQPAGSEPPRAVGFHDTRLREVPMKRFSNPYTLWMLQRTLDVYRALPAEERGRVDAALAGTGCEALLDYEPRHRMGKRDRKLVLER